MIKETPIVDFGTPDKQNTTEFQIDITPKLFEMLSGLYSNKIRAVIRELMCNAIDSHIDAGRPSDPVEITLPTTDFPSLVIRDFGVGMSHETVISIYTRYSKSTKMHDAATTGALGLGSKSPFCYTNMFVLVSVHDGIKSMYNMYINPQRIPSITLISTEESDDENGVTITIPVQKNDLWRFRDEMRYVASHMLSPYEVIEKRAKGDDVEYVDVTSQYPKLMDIVSYQMGNDCLIEKDPWGTSPQRVYVVQANVVYPVSSDEIVGELRTASLNRHAAVVILCDNGKISFSPTREELSLDYDTIEYIKERLNVLKIKVQAWAKYYGMKISAGHGLELLNKHRIVKFLYNYRDTNYRDIHDYWWQSSTRGSHQHHKSIQYYDKNQDYKLVKTSAIKRCPETIGFVLYDEDTTIGSVSIGKIASRIKQGNWSHGAPSVLFRVSSMNEVRRTIRRLKYTGKVEIRNAQLFKYADPSNTVARSIVISGANIGIVDIFTGNVNKVRAGNISISDGDLVFIRNQQDYQQVRLVQVRDDDAIRNFDRRYSFNINDISDFTNTMKTIRDKIDNLIVGGYGSSSILITRDMVDEYLTRKCYILTETQYEKLRSKTDVNTMCISQYAENIFQLFMGDISMYQYASSASSRCLEKMRGLATMYVSAIPGLMVQYRKYKIALDRHNRIRRSMSREAAQTLPVLYKQILTLWRYAYHSDTREFAHKLGIGIKKGECKTWGNSYQLERVNATISMNPHRSISSSSANSLTEYVVELVAYQLLQRAHALGLVDDMFEAVISGLGGVNGRFVDDMIVSGKFQELIERVSCK